MVISLGYQSCWHIQWLFTWLIEIFSIHGLQENTVILSFIQGYNFFPFSWLCLIIMHLKNMNLLEGCLYFQCACINTSLLKREDQMEIYTLSRNPKTGRLACLSKHPSTVHFWDPSIHG